MIEKTIDELTRSIDGDAWHGPSLCDLLKRVSAKHAAARHLPDVHSVWELVHHITAWIDAVHERVRGHITELDGDADWPPVADTSSKAWKAAVTDLRRAHAELIATLATLSDADLDKRVPNRDYQRSHLLLGLLQHNTYHSGQIALLARVATCPRSH